MNSKKVTAMQMIAADRIAVNPAVKEAKALNRYPKISRMPVNKCTTIVRAFDRASCKELEWNCLAFAIDFTVKGNVTKAIRV